MDFWQGLDFAVWENKGLTPLVNYNFTLQVEGAYNLPCKSVHVFQRQNEYEHYQEGGLNDYVHMLRKPISNPFTFQVERYVGVDMFDPLALGTDLILPVLLSVSRYQGEGAAGGWEQPQRIYTFTGCTVIAKEYGELNAERGGLLVETTTIAYREMICLDNPSTGMTKAMWDIKKDKDADGRPTNKYASSPDNMLSKSEMEERAQMYVDDKVKETPLRIINYPGKKISSKKNYKTGETKIGIATKNVMTPQSELEQEAKRFFFDESVSKAEYKGVSETSATTQKKLLGTAAMNKSEMEKAARMYVDPDLDNVPTHISQYKGTKVGTTTVGDKSVPGIATKMPMQSTQGQRRYDGTESTASADKRGREMTSKSEQMEKAKRYFLPGSKSVSTYAGTVATSATRDEQQLSKAEMERKAVRYNGTEETQSSDKRGRSSAMKETAGKRKYNGTEESQSADKRGRSSAMKETQGQRRYFIAGSKSLSAYKGTIRSSAKTNANELGKNVMAMRAKRYYLPGGKREKKHAGTTGTSAVTNPLEIKKPIMQKRARQWPPTRSAAEVAKFLKKN
ncbi:MAG: hypothetical protein J6B28_02740 [Eubacterium sp.]|nr:hypothetical protein [Eubacterium sp.]